MTSHRFSTLRAYPLVLLPLLLAACTDETPTADDDARPVADAPLFTISTSDADYATSLAMSGEYVHVAGWTQGSLDGPLHGAVDAFIRRYHPAGELLMADQFGTAEFDYANAIAADAAGNSWIGGFETGALAGWRGGGDAFLRRYDASGSVVWTRQFGSDLADDVYDIAVDAEGNAYVAGATNGHFARTNPNTGFTDAFVGKFDANGDRIWMRQFGTPVGDWARAIVVDDSGSVYVVGETDGGLKGAPQGGLDVFVRRYDADGQHLWTRQFGSTAREEVGGAVLDAAGALVISGSTAGDLAGHIGGWDAFARSYRPGGGVAWTVQLGTIAFDVAADIAADASGSTYIAGSSAGGTDPPSGTDAFVTRLSAHGAARWTRYYRAQGTAYALASAIGVAPSGLIYIAGTTAGTMGGGNRGLDDAFLLQLSANGRRLWTDY